MSMKYHNITGGMLAVLLIGALGAPLLAAQDKAAEMKLSGLWKVSVAAGEETYELAMEIKAVNGKLEGTISESMGAFANIPLTKLEFASDILKIEFKSATPPDGAERLVLGEFKVDVDKIEGMITVPELNISVPATAVRDKK